MRNWNFLNPTPLTEDINKTKNWLIKEYQESGEGFYKNWEIILNDIESKNFATINFGRQLVGFITWLDLCCYRQINIMSIKPELRMNGWGRRFLKEFERFTLENNLYAIKLFCSPKESKYFWKKLNFIEFPSGLNEPDLTYYKPLIGHLNSHSGIPSNRLQLWNKESHEVKQCSPSWTWDIDKISPKKSIIHPCNGNWKIKWTKNSRIKYEGEVKSFERYLASKIDFPPFIIIKALNN